MPSTLQRMTIGEELLTAIRLLKVGLRELNRMDGATDFFHLPILLLSSGFERMMKILICCHYLKRNEEFPTMKSLKSASLKIKTHELLPLLHHITSNCFSDSYLTGIPDAKDDIEFLRTERVEKTIRILGDFGEGARYYNLNVVLGESNPGPSPEEEWQKLEMEILKETPDWTNLVSDPKQLKAILRHVNEQLTILCEKIARSLSRLFTIGGLGEQALQISVHTHHFLFLTGNQLGKTDYSKIPI